MLSEYDGRRSPDVIEYRASEERIEDAKVAVSKQRWSYENRASMGIPCNCQ